MQYFEFLRSWYLEKKKQKKSTRTLNYMRQSNRETKRNHPAKEKKKCKMLLFCINKFGKDCILDKNRKVGSPGAQWINFRAFFILVLCFLPLASIYDTHSAK